MLFGIFVLIVKVVINIQLYEVKLYWIDFNVGFLVEDDVYEEFVLWEFIYYMIEVVSG